MSEPQANPNKKSSSTAAISTPTIDEILDGIQVTKPRTVSVEEAGRILGIGRMPAYQAVWRGQIPSIRIGRRLLVPLAKLNELVPPVEDDEPREADDQSASAA